MTFDELNAIAWRDFLAWAWRQPEMLAQFSAATSISIPAVTSAIDAMIDEATGADRGIVAHFIEWATREHWGLEHAPIAYQQALASELH